MNIWIMKNWDAYAAKIKNEIRPEDMLVLNGDDEQLLRQMAGVVCHTITYGYHLKSTVTISAGEEDVTTGRMIYTIALQRPMLNCENRLLEPCEFLWSAPVDAAAQSVLAQVAFFLVADVDFFL